MKVSLQLCLVYVSNIQLIILKNVSGPCKTHGDSNTAPGLSGESDIRHQVVAVGKNTILT